MAANLRDILPSPDLLNERELPLREPTKYRSYRVGPCRCKVCADWRAVADAQFKELLAVLPPWSPPQFANVSNIPSVAPQPIDQSASASITNDAPDATDGNCQPQRLRKKS